MPVQPTGITTVSKMTRRGAERVLKAAGYDVGKVDGVYSRSTFEAAKAFKDDHLKGNSHAGHMGIPAQAVLAKQAGINDGGDKGKDASVRAISFNWPARYRKGGEQADEKLFDRLGAQADVIGFQEFNWAESVRDNEKAWSFHHPDPKGDGAKGKARRSNSGSSSVTGWWSGSSSRVRGRW